MIASTSGGIVESGMTVLGAAGAYQIRDLGPLRTLEEEVLRLGRQLHGVNREVALLRERLRDDTDADQQAK